MGQFEIFRRKNGEFQFTLKATNGETILTSSGYMTKDSCKKGIESVRRNSTDRSKYELIESKGGTAFFNLHAANGRIIGVSEMYKNTDSRDKAIASVKSNAPQARIVDLSVRGSSVMDYYNPVCTV